MKSEAMAISSNTGTSSPSLDPRVARNEFNSLEKWLSSDEVGRMGLRSVEIGEELRGRELLRLLLQAHIDCRGDGDVGPTIEVYGTDQAKLYTHKRTHARNIVTIFGQVSVKRVGYGLGGKASIHPLDEQLQLPSRSYSYEIQRRLVKKAVQGPFDEAIEAIYESTGVKVPKRSAEQIVIDASMDFDRFYECRQDDGSLQTGPILVGSVDCKGIPMVKSELPPQSVRRRKGEKAQKKRMATVATVFTQRRYIRTPEEVVESLFDPDKKRDRKNQRRDSGPERKRVWASLEAGKDRFICQVNEEMKRRDPAGEKQHVVVTDGERALQLRVGRFITTATLVLDFLHVLEKLWASAHALHGEGTSVAEQFVRERALRLLQGKVGQVVKGLRQIVTKRKLNGSKKDVLLNTASYYYKNRTRMQYHDYLRQGLPIASGSVEGACKNLIKDRMERSGMRWSRKMAEAMVKMRACYLSKDFEAYWDYHVSQEQGRLYPKNRWNPGKSVVLK